MEYTSLPEMGMKVSRVALGGCPLGGHGWGKVEDADSITAVRTAVDEGVNFFDTADVYGLWTFRGDTIEVARRFSA